MAKKPITKKETTARAASAKGGVTISGGVHAGRDVIMGDQYNYFRQEVAQISSPGEFVAKVQELQAQIAALKQQPDLLPAQVESIEVVEGQVGQVIEEARKPQPLAARITAALSGAKGVIDSLGESVKSAIGLGAALAELGQVALKLFGGG
jgi:hypothetical protein